MIDYKTYKLLNEHLGQFNLGVVPVQSLGISSNRPGFSEVGLPPELSAKKGKPPIPGAEGPAPGEEDMPPIPGEDDELPPDELGDEELGDEDLDDDDIDDDDEEGDEEDDELDHEDDLDDLDDDDDVEGGDDLEGDPMADPMMDPTMAGLSGPPTPGAIPGLGKKPSPFMSKFMKKEAKEEDGVKGPEAFKSKGKKPKGVHDADEPKKGKEEGGPTFLMKKKCGTGEMDKKQVILGKSKKCSDGKMCKKCDEKMDKKMKNEGEQYARPKDYDPSEEAFLKSVREQLAQSKVNQKYDDGMRDFKKEDVLLPPPGERLESAPEPQSQQPQPGEPGFAPQGRIGGDFTAESITDIMKRLERLEKR